MLQAEHLPRLHMWHGMGRDTFLFDPFALFEIMLRDDEDVIARDGYLARLEHPRRRYANPAMNRDHPTRTAALFKCHHMPPGRLLASEQTFKIEPRIHNLA